MNSARLLIAAVFVLAGCGGSRATAEPTANRCQSASSALLDGLSTGLDSGLSLRNGQTVKSADYENAYFVSADIEGLGLDGAGDVATWVTNSLDGTAGFFSVSAVANELTDWGDGRTTDSQFAMADDGAREAEACARG